MTTMVTEIYDALKSINIDDDNARAVAIAMSERDAEFVKIDKRFAKVDQRFERVDGELKLHRWILATNTALLLAILWRVFT